MRRLFWRRLRQDRAAVVSACAVALILFALFVGPAIAQAGLGHGPNDLFPYAVDGNLKPVGPWTEVPAVHIARADTETDVTLPPQAGTPDTLLVFGADGGLGRDEFLRLLVGGRNSLTVEPTPEVPVVVQGRLHLSLHPDLSQVTGNVPVAREGADELLCIASWLEHRATSVRVLHCDRGLAEPVRRIATFEPVRRRERPP